jgi:HK97 family phage prohead protease
VLWAHDSASLPVGKADNVRVDGGALRADVKFTPEGMHPFNDTVFEMCKAGFLNATSVGFMPIDLTYSQDPARKMGIDFLEQELLEFSIVPVPANAEALIQGKNAGIDVAQLKTWGRSQLNDEDIILEAEQIAARGDLISHSAAGRIAAAAGIPVLTQARQRRIDELEIRERILKERSRRKRDMELIRLRGM